MLDNPDRGSSLALEVGGLRLDFEIDAQLRVLRHEARILDLELLDPQEEVGVPGGEAVHRGVGELGPCGWNLKRKSSLKFYCSVET